jgi:hypothetical protein
VCLEDLTEHRSLLIDRVFLVPYLTKGAAWLAPVFVAPSIFTNDVVCPHSMKNGMDFFHRLPTENGVDMVGPIPAVRKS